MARAAALAGPYATAALACEAAGLAAGERVLVDAASAGEAGLAALWLAREAGAEVYVAASAAQREYVESLGVAAVLDAEAPDLVERVLEATGGSGADVVLGDAPEALGPSLGTRAAGSWSWPVPGSWAEAPAERVEALLAGLAERIAAGELGLPPTRRCPLADVGAALRLARSGTARGRDRFDAGRGRVQGGCKLSGHRRAGCALGLEDGGVAGRVRERDTWCWSAGARRVRKCAGASWLRWRRRRAAGW